MTAEEHREFLFALLDSIDTTDDMAKTDNAAFRREVRRINKRRFEVASTDNYKVIWNE